MSGAVHRSGDFLTRRGPLNPALVSVNIAEGA